MFTPVALAGAAWTSACIEPELQQLALAARLHVPGTMLRLAIKLSLILTKTLQGVVTMTVPVFTDENPDGGLARSQNSPKVIWLVNGKPGRGQTSRTLESGLFTTTSLPCAWRRAGHVGEQDVISILQGLCDFVPRGLGVLEEDHGFTAGFLLCFVRVLLPAPQPVGRGGVLLLLPRTSDRRWGSPFSCSCPSWSSEGAASMEKQKGALALGEAEEGCSCTFCCQGSLWCLWICNLVPWA